MKLMSDILHEPLLGQGATLPALKGSVQDALAKALPHIPASIRVREGFEIDTSGKVWRMPPQLSYGSINWNRIRTTPAMLRVLMGYVAALLKGKSERYAGSEFLRFCRIQDWSLLTDPWEQNGNIGQADILSVQKSLKRSCEGAWREYFLVLKRFYAWAAEKGVPGFTEAVCEQLKQVKVGRSIPFLRRLDVAPGMSRSKVTKNRKVYDESTMTLIAAYYHKAEGLLRSGQVLYRPVRPEESLMAFGVTLKEGRLMRPSRVGLYHLILGWLAWRFGDRPDAFRKLRESHFEFIAEDGETVLTQIRLPESKIRHANYQAVQGPLPLGDELARLVPELIAENRAIRERVGLDNTLDWPLFMVAQEGGSAHVRKRTAMPHEDPAKSVEKLGVTLGRDLQTLFEALQVPDGQGGVIVPTFYSFRDGFATNHIQAGTPPEVVAALHNKQVRSLEPYYKPGVRFLERLDLVPEFSRLAEAFAPANPIPLAEVEKEALVPLPAYVEIDTEGNHVGATGRCGCIGAPACPITMNGSADCYLCPAFRAIAEGPHPAVYEALWARREAMILRGLPEREFARYDRHLAACGAVISKIERMGGATE